MLRELPRRHRDATNAFPVTGMLTARCEYRYLSVSHVDCFSGGYLITFLQGTQVSSIETLGFRRIYERGLSMIRFRINELIAECNESSQGGERIHMQIVADAIGVARSTLANLTRGTREPVTNTALVECLCRFFFLRHPDFEPSLLLEFTPRLEDTTSTHIDELYPQRAARSRRR